MSRKITLVALLAIALVVLVAAPALAEGYNTGADLHTRAEGYFSGPHGGYTTTTNKCQDCHSTHYASGSFMLLRASSREAACDYCHGGGGGSTINIMMDNDYKNVGSSELATGVAIAVDSMGKGTGHTLGYTGKAPADIKPAYSDPDGFACFDCHSPHGNSARIMTTMSNPGRAFASPGNEGRPTTAQLNDAAVTTNQWEIVSGYGKDLDSDGLLDDNEWGVDRTYGNFVWDGTSTVGVVAFRYRPIWPSGRWLLLKDPHSTVDELQADTSVAATTTVATGGVNKYAINWDEPLGPADGTYGGYQDNDNDGYYPFAPGDGNNQNSPAGTGGFLALSEFCTDCHDGTAGASTQKAEVYQPGAAGDGYVVAYSHDAQPRH
ncbi:MAG: hypothetical protein ACYC77_02000 [Coriobacteriia bacterium]